VDWSAVEHTEGYCGAAGFIAGLWSKCVVVSHGSHATYNIVNHIVISLTGDI